MSKLTIFPQATKHTPVAHNNGRLVCYAELLSDVTTLINDLPKQQYQINLCENRYYFLVGFLAAMSMGQIVLLPPSRAKLEINNIEKEHDSVYRLIDKQEDRGDSEYYLLDDLDGKQIQDTASIRFAMEQVVVKLYTSGSTGSPVAHSKTWGALYQGALLTGKRIQLSMSSKFALLATVPPQHMYGLETSIMLPLVWNGIVTAEKPLMPDDISAYAAGLPSPLLFTTTPVHISSCVRVKTEITNIKQILSSTAPLTRKLACEAQDLFAAEVIEIYGSTETGAIATRYSAREDGWTLLPGIELQDGQETFSVQLTHYDDIIKLHDNIEIIDNHKFRLLGRSSDLVKIAGKRASLGDLNTKLLEINEVNDGVFYIPENTTSNILRASVFVVADESSRQNITNALKERIDPAFMPRELVFVDKLPRNATGKISKDSLDKLYRQQ